MDFDKKKILFLTSRFPFPLEKGDKLRAYHQIKALSKKHEVILCSVTNNEIEVEWENELKAFCSEIHVFKLRKISIFFNTLISFLRGKPLQIGFFYQNWIKNKILKIVKDQSPDFIFCQLIRVAEYVKDIHSIPKTLDYMDALSAGMTRRAGIAKRPFKYVFNLEGRRLKLYENKIYDYFNDHSIISAEDRRLVSHPNNDKIKIVPNGIDDYFLNYQCELNKEYDLVFVGNLSYAPNVESCCFIVERILPFLRDKGLSPKVLISGASPSPRVLKLKDYEGITISGWVDDIRESYCKGRVFVAPLFIGTGLQNKLLEAMALKVPCVTTCLVNKGLGATDKEHLMIADTVEEFGDHIIHLIQNEKQAVLMSDNAKNFVSTKYNWANSLYGFDWF